MEEMRLYTAGISDFERIREDNRIYIDKTDLIYQLTKESQFIFLSRPRRFGKTLLCGTLQYYFQGRKDLFEGLKIEQLERTGNNILCSVSISAPANTKGTLTKLSTN